MKALFTIGYEGKTQEEMLDELKSAGVALLIDVRAVAASSGRASPRPRSRAD